MDVRMPAHYGRRGCSSPYLASNLAKTVLLLVLTTFDDYVSQAMRLPRKATHSDDLAAAIRAVHKGYTEWVRAPMKKAIFATRNSTGNLLAPLSIKLPSPERGTPINEPKEIL